MLIEGDGCIATPVLRLFKGSYFLVKMKTITPRRATLMVQQEVLPYSNFSVMYDAGCWFYAEGGLEYATSRVLFTFTFSTPIETTPGHEEEISHPYSFVVDSIRVEGPTLPMRRMPPKRFGWNLINMEMRVLGAAIVFPFVVILGIFIPICSFLYYL